MDTDKILEERDLYDRYLDYRAAHATRRLAERSTARGDHQQAAEWQKLADERSAAVVSDRDALQINVFIDRNLTWERHDIVTRLRAQDPPTSWTDIGELLGMSKQAAHRWHTRGFTRHIPPSNPTVITS